MRALSLPCEGIAGRFWKAKRPRNRVREATEVKFEPWQKPSTHTPHHTGSHLFPGQVSGHPTAAIRILLLSPHLPELSVIWVSPGRTSRAPYFALQFASCTKYIAASFWFFHSFCHNLYPFSIYFLAFCLLY